MDRRRFIHELTAGAVVLAAPGVFAQRLAETARTTEGPFYPDRLPLDVDNDLLIVNDAITPAVGEVTRLGGRVLTASGEPVRNALVEIWQTDSGGSYIHTGGRQPSGFDGNFQGYGRFETDSRGRYAFRTIKPVEYTLRGMHRAPHVHFAIGLRGRRVLTTQMLVKGHPANVRDGVTRRMAPRELQSILVDFVPVPGSKAGELAAAFDIVLADI
jgi:protocatechuate 3,4-dioxygenase beta subunit